MRTLRPIVFFKSLLVIIPLVILMMVYVQPLENPVYAQSSGGKKGSGGSVTASTACIPGALTALTDSATVTWAGASALCPNAKLTFTAHSGSRTLNLTGLAAGATYFVELIQDGTGGESLTGGSGCTWIQPGGGGSTFTLTATAGALDTLSFLYDGTNCVALLNKAFS